MIRSTRTIQQILAWPQTDAEERIADAHIRQASAAIRDAWHPDELAIRATASIRGTGVERPGWTPPVICTDEIE
jgi:hypothetical protein